MNKLIFPVFEFRPLNDLEYLRYAEGNWIKDDGEYDLAFICRAEFPSATGFEHPYYKNIRWSWCKNGDWGATVKKHPNGNAWHYMLKPSCKQWGNSWGRDKHPNIIAYESAMDKCSSLCGCANGGGPEYHINDPYIKAGLVRNAETKRVLRFPKIFNCMDCGKIDWRKAENK